MRNAFSLSRRLIVFSVATVATCLFLPGVARAQDETPAPDAATNQEGTQIDPNEVLKKGQAALNEGDFEAALPAFDQLARAGQQGYTPQHLQLQLIGLTGRAQALAGLKEYDAALEDFKASIELQENFVPALVARGQMYLEIGNPQNYPAALADFQRAVKAERGNLAAQFGLGKASILTGNYQDGIGPLTRVLAAEPEHAEAYRLRGTGYSGVFKFKEATADLQQAIKLNPEDYEAYFALGIIYLRNEDYQGAVEQLGKSIEHYKPKPGEEEQPFVQGYLTRSSAFVELGKKSTEEAAKKAAFQAAVDEAQKLLDQLDEKNPYTAGVRAATLYSRGVGERMLGQLGKAIRTFSEAIELNPELGEAYFRRGICFHLIGEDRMAIADFVEAANINYDDPRANLWEGFTHAKLGNSYEALRAYGNAIAASDRYTPAYINRGLTYMTLGEYEKAIEDFTAAIRLEPTNADYYFKRGLAYERLGDNQKASESFARAIQHHSQHAAAHRHMADVLQSVGRTQEANEYRQKANEFAPQQNAQ